MIHTEPPKKVESDPYRNIKTVILFLLILFLFFGWMLHTIFQDDLEPFQKVHETIQPYPDSKLYKEEEDSDILDGDTYLRKLYEIDPNVTNESVQNYFKTQLTEDGWKDIEDVSKYICGLKAKKDDYELELLCERNYWYDDGTTIKISEYGFLTSVNGKENMYYYDHASDEDLKRILNLIRFGNPYGGTFIYSVEVRDVFPPRN